MELRRIEPVDVLFLRGNRLFGGPGQHGEALMPPWPSVFSGAVASLALAQKGLIPEISSRKKAENRKKAEEFIARELGDQFACTVVGMIFGEGGAEKVFLPCPADIVCFEEDKNTDEKHRNELSFRRLIPRAKPSDVSSSYELPLIPVFPHSRRVKPLSGIWMDLEGWKKYLDDTEPCVANFVRSSELWALDFRLGIARNKHTLTIEKGKLYTSEAVALKPRVAFLAGFSGKNIPESGLLRLGGDGRGATISTIQNETIHKLGQMGKPASGWDGFKMILMTPGIFPEGWLPPFCTKTNGRCFFNYKGLKAELEAAALARPHVVSGWDMAGRRPKPAEKAVPIGSVYWFKVTSGDTNSLVDLWEQGLWNDDSDQTHKGRKREGFNRVWFGKWDPSGK